MPLYQMILSILLLAATISPCYALVPKQLKQATRGDVVQRLANAALHPPRPRRSSVPGDCTTLPTGTAPDVVQAKDIPYNLEYSGSGFTENHDNPGNPSPHTYPPRSTDLGFLDIPDAVQACAVAASNLPGAYQSFDLHFRSDGCNWICVQYLSAIDGNNMGTYFDQPNVNVAIAYGYSF